MHDCGVEFRVSLYPCSKKLNFDPKNKIKKYIFRDDIR